MKTTVSIDQVSMRPTRDTMQNGVLLFKSTLAKLKNPSSSIDRFDCVGGKEIAYTVPLETTISSSSTVMFLRRSTLSLCPLIRKFSTNNTPFVENAIAELNKEMESVFGDALSTSDLSSTNGVPIAHEPHFVPPQHSEHIVSLTHINSGGEAQMVDVSSKAISKRVAIAGCKVLLGKKVFDMVSANQIAKGDVLSVARIAGINGAKQTSNLIPLCHNINLTHVRVDLTLNEKDFSVEIEGEAASTGKTGVEMEAMTAVTIAGLTVYDMCKAASKDIRMMDVQLEHKSGGKSGEWSRMQ